MVSARGERDGVVQAGLHNRVAWAVLAPTYDGSIRPKSEIRKPLRRDARDVRKPARFDIRVVWSHHSAADTQQGSIAPERENVSSRGNGSHVFKICRHEVRISTPGD